MADGFESGAFGGWTSVTVEGDARATVESPDAHTGGCSGRFQISTASTSRANITRSLPAGTSGAWADGWFRVDGEGTSGSNVGFLRFFDGTNRIADIYRQNGSGGIWFRTTNASGAFVYTSLGVDVPLRAWVHVRFHVIAAGSSSTIEAWIDGTRRYSSAAFWLPTSRLTTLLLGSEHVKQAMDLRFDDILLGLG